MTAYILRNLAPFSVIMRETEGPANVVDGPSVYEPATCRWDNWVKFGFYFVHTEKLRGPYVENMHTVPMHSDRSTTVLRLGTARPLMGHVYGLAWRCGRISPMAVIVGK